MGVSFIGESSRSQCSPLSSLRYTPVSAPQYMTRASLGCTTRARTALSLGASGWQTFLHLRIRAALPIIFNGIEIAAVFAVIGAVVGEFVGASAGLGMLLMQYDQQMELAPLFAVIVLLAVIGFLMHYAVTVLERRYCFWAQRANAAARL